MRDVGVSEGLEKLVDTGLLLLEQCSQRSLIFHRALCGNRRDQRADQGVDER